MTKKIYKPLEEGEQKGIVKPKPTTQEPQTPPPPQKPQNSQKPNDKE